MPSEPPVAGAALDAAVARVLGLHQHTLPEQTEPFWCTSLERADSCAKRGGATRPPPFSTDWGAAMQVFAAMVARVGWGSLWADMEEAHGQDVPYGVQFGTAAPVCAPGPLAVCRAALAALQIVGETDG